MFLVRPIVLYGITTTTELSLHKALRMHTLTSSIQQRHQACTYYWPAHNKTINAINNHYDSPTYKQA